MTVGGLWARVTGTAVVTALLVAGCGDVDAGDAFADEFDAYLDTQRTVVAHDVGGRNDLPFSGSATTEVTISPDLGTAEVVRAATAIVTHRTKTGASHHDVTMSFTTEGVGGAEVVTSFYVDAAGPLPRTKATRARVAGLVALAQDYARSAEGITSVVADSSAVTVRTTSDPFAATPAVTQVLRAGDVREPTPGRPVDPDLLVTRGVEEVRVEDGGDVAWMSRTGPYLRAVRAQPDVVSIRTSVSGTSADRGPSLRVELRYDAPDSTLAATRRLDPPAGVQVEVAKADAPTPSPTPTTTPSR